MSKQVHGAGNPNARMMIVGEAPGNQEVYEGLPFIGHSGDVLNEMLREIGLRREDLFVSNVCHIQPPKNKMSEFFATKSDAKKMGLKEIDGKFPLYPVLEGMLKLQEEINEVDPEVIIAAGNTALWALTGLSGTGNKTTDKSPTGITSWRGSQLVTKPMWGRRRVVPIIHPAGISRKWEQRWFSLIDLRRSQLDGGRKDWTVPQYRFIVRPSFKDVCAVLSDLERRCDTNNVVRLALDVETRLRCIACIGIAWSPLDAICIPTMCVENKEGYWSREEEASILWRIGQLVRRPNVQVVGQNWDYDRQYFARNYGLNIPAAIDTMVSQHVLLPGTPKGLDFLSSIYCGYHQYWKDEGKEWDPALNEEQLWIYNCKDAVITYEVSEKQEVQIHKAGRETQVRVIMRQADPVFKMELRGIARDNAQLHVIRSETQAYLAHLAFELDSIIPQRVLPRPPLPPGPYDAQWWKTHQHPLARKKRKGAFWFDSPDQQKKLFYIYLQLPTKFKIDKEKGRIPTVEDTALEELKEDEPALAPFFERLIQYRSFKTLLANFLNARSDWDGRNRTNLSYAGPETFRYSSSTDVFGFGSNLQNITKGDK